MTQASDELWNAIPSADQALTADNAAIADPSKASAAEQSLGELLADVLGYEPESVSRHARRLLVGCGNDYDGLRKMIVELRIQGELGWATRFNIYGFRNWLIAEYDLRRKLDEVRAFENSPKGRRRYIEGKYADYIEG